ncbi:MAG TPA: glycosyltransferase family 4 protein [Thermoleophilaceae bacterium]|nr:glycosyltransferase family 4 protein [Thermoleophilaceae bacterium]
MSTPPQALFVSYTSLLGGAERILLDHATALPGPVVLACPEGPLAERARAAGIDVVALRNRRVELRASARDRLAMPLRMTAQGREVRRIAARRRPGCLVAWGMRALLSCAAGLRGLRPHRPLVFQHNDLLPSPLVGRAVRAAARRADLTIALSQAIAADLDPNRKLGVGIEVVRAGVDLTRFRPAGTPPSDPPSALLLGAIVDWKRPDLALEATALAARELPNLRLRIAGAPLAAAGSDLLAELEHRTQQPDLAARVDIDGRIEDVPAALAASTCLLHCADREPYGMALVEALACGRPIAAPAAGGPLEIVDASCGVLYPPGNARAAATALVDVVTRAPELGRGARARAEAEFDRQRARDRFRSLLEELVA